MVLQREKVYASAQRLVQRGQADKAIAELQQLLDADPDDVRTRLRIADLQSQTADMAGAIASYQWVSSAYAHQGFYLKAIAAQKQILRLAPRHLPAHEALAELYKRMQSPQEAFAAYRQLLSLQEQEQQLGAAVTTLTAMLALDPKQTSVQVRLAETYLKQGKTEQALSTFAATAAELQAQQRDEERARVLERLCYLNPNDRDSGLSLTRLCLQRKEPARALVPLQALYRGAQHDVEVLQLLVESFLLLAQPHKAAKVLRQLVAAHAAAGPAHLVERQAAEARLTDLLAAHPLPVGAAAAVDSAIRQGMEQETFGSSAATTLSPNDVERLLAEAESFARLGLLQNAIRLLRQVMQAQPQRLEAVDHLLRLLLASERTSEAAELLWQRIAAADPLTDGARRQQDLTTLLTLSPDHPEALALRDQLLAAMPAALVGELAEVDFYLQQGLLSEARESLLPQLATYPEHPELMARQRRLQDLLATAELAPAPPQGGEAHLQLGLAYKEMGLFDEARREASEAASDPAWTYSAGCLTGLCYLQAGDVAGARSTFAALCAAPQRSLDERLALRYDLACAYEGMARPADAAAFFASCCALLPDYRDAAERLAQAQQRAAAEAQQATGEIDLAALEAGAAGAPAPGAAAVTPPQN